MVDIYRNFLKEDFALDLYNSICDTPSNWWFDYIKYSNKEEAVFHSNNLNGQLDIVAREKELQENISSDFLFKFKRSSKHVETCTCYECTFIDTVLKSENFLNFLKENTSIKNPVLDIAFTSIYEQGDFLGVHTDKGHSVAFVFNLSPNWKPEYGGMLNVLTKGVRWEAIFPEFGSLILFDVSGNGRPHFVSEITRFAPGPRIAISGWYNEG